jgi:anti-sigma factor ChrR (cupin superfamily)
VNAVSRGCDRTELAAEFAIRSLPAREAAEFQTHLAGCAACREELAKLRPVVDSFVDWPTDVLRPPAPLWQKLAKRIGVDGEVEPETRWAGEPEWKQVGDGISCKMLACDEVTQRVSLLVRLAPGAAYPPHAHRDVEELHLLAGELWIEDRKLHPGDFNRAEPGTADRRVWSETGCTCVLLTSMNDVIG